jgi:hypothetical protein
MQASVIEHVLHSWAAAALETSKISVAARTLIAFLPVLAPGGCSTWWGLFATAVADSRGRPHPEVAAGLWLSVASAFAQDAPPDIVLHLRPGEIAEIARLVDLATAAQS